jgi:hypothetical protein
MFRQLTLWRSVAAFLLLVSGVANAQRSEYGNTYFEATGSDETHASFMSGVLILHSFEYEDAAAAFRNAQKLTANLKLRQYRIQRNNSCSGISSITPGFT